MSSKVEIYARIVSTAYHMLFLVMENESLGFCLTGNYEYTKASCHDFHMLCAAISCAPNDYVGIADGLAKIINGYKEKVLPELSDISPDVEYYAQNVLHCMHKMHRYCLDQLSK